MSGIESELALLTRIRAGDKAACDDCIREHSPGIYRLALRLMRDEYEAEEVLQETFLNAFKGIDRFDGRSGLRTWLYRIAYNAAMMRLRRPKREFISVEEASDPEAGTPVPQELFDWSNIPAETLEKSELRNEMAKAIRELPEKLKVVFMMRDLEDFSTEETAAALGVKIEVVKTRLHRARLRLRESLSVYFASGAPAGQR
jgi:RNA polymerase sigma-70 factor (ECF subfamily)